MKTHYFIIFFLISFFSIPFFSQAQTSRFRSLYQGSRGSEVYTLQYKLQQKGYFPANISPTGYFGVITRKAVIDFQRATRLPIVGIFGPLTNAALTRTLYSSSNATYANQPTNYPFSNLPPSINSPAYYTYVPNQNVPTVIPPAQTHTQTTPYSPTAIPSMTAQLDTNVATILPVVNPPQVPQPIIYTPPPPTSPLLPTITQTTMAKTALPLYIYPSPNEQNWATAIGAGSNVEFIVANVNSGPGVSVESVWTNMISRTASAGIKVYGYVDTNYGTIDGVTVDRNVASWFQYYPQITGIFFDQTASDAGNVPYYKARYDHVKRINPTSQVVINPGTNTDEGYMSASDVNILFESSYASWQSKLMPSWVSQYPKERFYAIVYDVPSEAMMKDVVTTAKQRNFGKIFVTNAPTPSDPLPPYFQTELVEISK